MDKILMPTDFTAVAAEKLKKLYKVKETEFEILFTHLFFLPDGTQDLLFSTYRVNESSFITDEFKEAYFECIQVPEKLKKHTHLPVKFFYGNTLIYFKNFLNGNNITHIAYSSLYETKKLNSSSIKAETVIYKCGLPLLDIEQNTLTFIKK